MIWLLVPVAAWLVLTITLVLLSWRRPQLGLLDGRLHPCGGPKNGVCSQGGDAAHAVQPLRFEGDAETAFRGLREIVDGQPQTALVTASENYARYEFATPLLRYVDDVEFLLSPGEQVIHVRSAARVGYADMGVNRKRIEEIREWFDAMPARWN